MNGLILQSDKEIEQLIEKASLIKAKGWKSSTKNVYGNTTALSFRDKNGNTVEIYIDIAKIMLVDTVSEPFYAVNFFSETKLPVMLGMFITDKLDNGELFTTIKKARQIIVERLEAIGL